MTRPEDNLGVRFPMLACPRCNAIGTIWLKDTLALDPRHNDEASMRCECLSCGKDHRVKFEVVGFELIDEDIGEDTREPLRRED